MKIICNSNYYWYLRFKTYICPKAEINWCGNWSQLCRYPKIIRNESILKEAAYRNDDDIIKLFIKANFEHRQHSYNSVVMICIENNNSTLAQYIIDHTKVTKNNKMLTKACSRGFMDSVNMLLYDKLTHMGWIPLESNRGCPPEISGQVEPVNPAYENNIVMRRAIKHGHPKIVERLLQCPEVDPCYNNMIFIVMAASGKTREHNIIFEILLEHTNDPSIWNNRSLIKAAGVGNYYLVDLLLHDNRVNISDVPNKAIIEAARYGYYMIVELLINDPRVNSSTHFDKALEIASKNGHYKVVELLLKNSKSNLSFFANNSMVIAEKKGRDEIVELLLNDERMDPSFGGNEVIRIASERGYYNIVKLLLEDPRVDPSNNNNEALVLASKTGNHKTVKLLLGDKRVETMYINDPYVPIVSASSKNCCKVVEILLNYQNVDILVLDNNSYIRWAAEYGYYKMVETLIADPRVDPSALDNDALIRAISFKYNCSMVKLLLDDPRVDPSARNNLPMKLAVMNGFDEYVELLLKHPKGKPFIKF
jgi:ankyrin repeat protein